MTHIAPFRALRPAPGREQQVASRPYDVLNSAEARAEASGNPYSFLRVTKSEIALPDNVHPYSQLVYAKAKENLEALMAQGVLFREQQPCYYVYRLVMDGRSQTGLVCASSVNDYENGVIKKHEFTRPEKEQDRITHIATTGAQTGNVFLAYRNEPTIDGIIETWTQGHPPAYDFTADDGIRHTIWVIDEPATITRITDTFATEVPCTYIADGHHRAASAAKVRASLGENAGAGAYFFLTTLFPASQLVIMDYNRAVRDLNGLTPQQLLAALGRDFDVTPSDEAVKPANLHEFGMYLNGSWYRLRSRPGTYTEDPIGVLDVTVLQERLLHPILGIGDPRTDHRIDFIGGIRGLGELKRRVDGGDMAVAFSLHPVTIQQLFDIADSGQVMPPKSTWFEPKLRDGLLTHLIHG
jgi:uncharacterized protein (DUF1015 family)